jgi:hypothetical protein
MKKHGRIEKSPLVKGRIIRGEELQKFLVAADEEKAVELAAAKARRDHRRALRRKARLSSWLAFANGLYALADSR